MGTVHEHIVADAFRSKKSSSALLVDEQQSPQRDGFQASIQLLVVATGEIYIGTQAVCAKRLNFKRWHINVFNFQQR